MRRRIFVERDFEFVVVALHVHGVAGIHVIHPNFGQRVATLDDNGQLHGVVLIADGVKEPLVATRKKGFAHERHDDGV